MRSTKKLTISAMSTALSSVILLFSSLFGLMELSVGAVASLLVVFVNIEVKGAYPWLVWLSTSLISLLLFPSKTIGAAYLTVFGIYPILKVYIERIPSRAMWLAVKLVYISVVTLLFLFLSEMLLGVPFFEEVEGVAPTLQGAVKAGMLALIGIAFFAYDAFITVLVRLYFLKFREKFRRILK